MLNISFDCNMLFSIITQLWKAIIKEYAYTIKSLKALNTEKLLLVIRQQAFGISLHIALGIIYLANLSVLPMIT